MADLGQSGHGWKRHGQCDEKQTVTILAPKKPTGNCIAFRNVKYERELMADADISCCLG
jgi:hypothetical protein